MDGPDVGGGFTPGGGGVCLLRDENSSRARCVAIFSSGTVMMSLRRYVPEDEEARQPRYRLRLILGSRVNGADVACVIGR